MKIKKQEIRSFDCIRYGTCLAAAALHDGDMDCSGCEMKDNSGGALHTDSEGFLWEFNAVLRLMVEVFNIT